MDANNSSGNFISGKHESYWIDTTSQTNYPSLKRNIEADVVIIGGGIAGLTSAHLLKKAGKKVVVLDARKIVTGVTGYTTAKITSLHTLIYSYLVRQFGNEKAKQYALAQESGLEFVAKLVDEYKIECDFTRVPAFTYAWDDKQDEMVKKEAEVAKSLGLPASYIPKIDLPFKTRGAVRFVNQARFHPRKYLLKLANLIVDKENFIFENTRAIEVKEETPLKVVTENGNIKANDVIVATNYPILNKGMFYTKLTPLRSYVFGAHINNHFPDGMYISSERPVFSLRLQPTSRGNMLIITGEEHKTGETPSTSLYYKNLENMAKKFLKISSIDYYWSTQDAYSIDMVPYVGRFTPDSENLYLATGFAGWGMTNAAAAGIILSDMITDKKNAWEEVFDPSRKQLKSAGKYISQNISVGKRFIKDKLSKTKVNNINEIERGEAGIITKENEKIGVYKDEKGRIVSLSTKCTHLGCQVNFNDTEKSWDCPCHGSRFDINGEVIQGPAIKPLRKRNTEIEK